MRIIDPSSVIQNEVSVAIVALVGIGKYHLNAEIVFHIAPKTWFGQLKNLFNAAVLSRISYILNHCPSLKKYAKFTLKMIKFGIYDISTWVLLMLSLIHI